MRSGNWTVFQAPDGSWQYALTHNPRTKPPVRELLTPQEAAARRSAQYAQYRQAMADSRDFSGGYQNRGNLGAPAIVGINPYALASTISRAALAQLVDALVPWPVQMWNELLPIVFNGTGTGGGTPGGHWTTEPGWALSSVCRDDVPRWLQATWNTEINCNSQGIADPAQWDTLYPLDGSKVKASDNRLWYYGRDESKVYPSPYVQGWSLRQYNRVAGASDYSVPRYVETPPVVRKVFPSVQPRFPLELWPLANPPSVPVSRGGSLPLGWSNGAKHAQADLPDGSRGGNAVPGTGVPAAGPKPGTGAGVVVDAGNGQRPPTVTPVQTGGRKPPGRGEKQKKGQAQTALAKLYNHALEVGEALDILEAIYEALPSDVRSALGRNPTPQEMAWAIFTELDKLDLSQAVQNVIANQVEDAILGRGFAKGDEAMKRLTGMTRSVWFS